MMPPPRRFCSRSLFSLLSLLVCLQGWVVAAWAADGSKHAHLHVGAGFVGVESGDPASVSSHTGHHHSQLEHHVHAPSDTSVVPAPGDTSEQHDGSCAVSAFLALASFFSWPATAYAQAGVVMPLWICTSRALARLERPPNGQ